MTFSRDDHCQVQWPHGNADKFRKSLANAHKIRPRCDLDDWSLCDAARFWIGESPAIKRSLETLEIPDGFITTLAAVLLMQDCERERQRRYELGVSNPKEKAVPLCTIAYFPQHCLKMRNQGILTQTLTGSSYSLTQSDICSALFENLVEHDPATSEFVMQNPTNFWESCGRSHCTAYDSSMPHCIPESMWEKHPEFFTPERLNYQGLLHLIPSLRSVLSTKPPTVSIKRQRSHKTVNAVPRMVADQIEGLRLSSLSYIKEAAYSSAFRERLTDVLEIIGNRKLQYRFMVGVSTGDSPTYVKRFDERLMVLMYATWRVVNPILDLNQPSHWGIGRDEWSSLAVDADYWKYPTDS